MTVSDYGEDLSIAVLHVEIGNVSEGNETIFEAPVTSVPLTIAIIVKNNWKETKILNFIKEKVIHYSNQPVLHSSVETQLAPVHENGSVPLQTY